MKTRIENERIYCHFGYMPNLSNELKRQCGAKWNPQTKEWYFETNMREKADKLFLSYLAESTQNAPKLVVEYKAVDFDYSNGRQNNIRISGCVFAARERRDDAVILYHNTYIVSGEFAERGGSAGYPSIGNVESVILRSEISQDFYDSLTEHTQNKLKIVQVIEPAKPKKEVAEAPEKPLGVRQQREQLKKERLTALQAEEKALLARLEIIRKEMTEL